MTLNFISKDSMKNLHFPAKAFLMRTFHLLLFASNWIDVSSNTDWENVFAL